MNSILKYFARYSKITIIGLLFIGTIINSTGCSDKAANPTFGSIDTTGNGDEQESPWILEGPVTYSSGLIKATNTSLEVEDSTIARCTLKEPVDFGEASGVIFTWRELVGRNASYEFFIGGDTARMVSLLHEQIQDDIQRALISFHGSFSEPLYSRFEFKLPASTSVEILNYLAKGE